MPVLPHTPLSPEQISIFQAFLDEMGGLDTGQVTDTTVTLSSDYEDEAHIEAQVLFVIPVERGRRLMEDIFNARPRNPLNMSGDSDGVHTHFDPAAINRQDTMG